MVGVPIDSFGKPGGTVLAPAALRDQGIVEILGARDGGDLDVRIVGTERDPESGIVGYPTVVSTCKGVRDGVAPLIRGGAFPVSSAAAARSSRASPPRSGRPTRGPRAWPTSTATSTSTAADVPLAVAVGHGDRWPSIRPVPG